MFTQGQTGHVDEHNILAAQVFDVDRYASIQAAIDAAASVKGFVLLNAGTTYREDGITIPSGVTVGTWSAMPGYLAGGSPTSTATIRALDSGSNSWVVSMPSTSYGASLVGVNVHGNSRCGGVLVEGDGCAVRKVSTFNTSGPGVETATTAVRAVIESVLILNPSLSVSALSGGLHLKGTDAIVHDVEAVGLNGAGPRTANAYNAAVIVGGWNNSLTSVVGEFGDSGIVVSGSLNKLSNCRADRNWGDGFVVTGTRNSFSSCGANSNGYNTESLYDGWSVSAGANGFAACHSVGLFGDAGTQRYGFYDTVSSGTLNQYAACIATDNGTAALGGAGFP